MWNLHNLKGFGILVCEMASRVCRERGKVLNE